MTSAEPQPGVEGIQKLLQEFVDAFESLDLDRFLACWGTGATVIHPFPEMPRRLDSWEALQRAWVDVFDFIRATRPGPPYLDLRPVDLDVRMAGVGVAVATFHLTLDGDLGRRTLVVEYQDGSWKIVHLHASNVPLTDLAP